MPPVSADNPYYFITSVTHKRLPVFRQRALQGVLASSFDEARKSGKFSIFSYVIMPEHYHIVTDSSQKPSVVVRYLNGISARRVINYLKENNFDTSLEKLRKQEVGKKDYRYSLWEHHSNTFLITTESMMLKKVNYIHRNPVEEGLVGSEDEYAFSSARFWNRAALLDNEPLYPDLKQLTWKNGGRASF